MALKKTVRKQDRFDCAYHRIGEVRYKPKEHIRVTLYSYLDAADRQAGNDPMIPYKTHTIPLVRRPQVKEEYTDVVNGEEVARTRFVEGDPEYVEDGMTKDVDILSRAYRILKTQDEWADAEDA